jgi:hypothetical protein
MRKTIVATLTATTLALGGAGIPRAPYDAGYSSPIPLSRQSEPLYNGHHTRHPCSPPATGWRHPHRRLSVTDVATRHQRTDPGDLPPRASLCTGRGIPRSAPPVADHACMPLRTPSEVRYVDRSCRTTTPRSRPVRNPFTAPAGKTMTNTFASRPTTPTPASASEWQHRGSCRGTDTEMFFSPTVNADRPVVETSVTAHACLGPSA